MILQGHQCELQKKAEETVLLHYLVRYHEAAEEIPKHVERGSNNGSHIVVGSDSSCHHAIKGEIQHSKVHKKCVPQKLRSSPFKGGHRVEYRAVN